MAYMSLHTRVQALNTSAHSHTPSSLTHTHTFIPHTITPSSLTLSQVVIKYVPYVGDSKRAMEEYTSEIFMGGQNTIVLHNTCEDSLLAAPIILDLVILGELAERIQVKTGQTRLAGIECI